MLQLGARELGIMGRAFWPMLVRGVEYTIPLAVISFLLGLVLAMAAALAIINKVPVLVLVARLYVWIFRGTPLLVQLFIVFWGICSPLGVSKWIAAVIAFSLNVGAYAAETIRAAILSIPAGQWEAGQSIGMSYGQIFWRIITPQAAKVAMPPLFNSFISLVKDTSLASTIMIGEMFRKAQEFAASSFEYFWLYTEVALIYLLFCTVLTFVQKQIECKLRVGK